MGFSDESTGGKLINNIFYDTVREGGSVYSVDDSSLPGFSARGNLAYNPGCAAACSWGSPITEETGAVLNEDQLFAGPSDPSLQPGFPAIDRGGYLTLVAASDAGGGTSFVVEDAGFFQDGWAGVEADWIAVGTPDNAAGISAIDYESDTITPAGSLPRAAGDPVWLYRDSDGTVVLSGAGPDIGAKEYSGGD